MANRVVELSRRDSVMPFEINGLLLSASLPKSKNESKSVYGIVGQPILLDDYPTGIGAPSVIVVLLG